MEDGVVFTATDPGGPWCDGTTIAGLEARGSVVIAHAAVAGLAQEWTVTVAAGDPLPLGPWDVRVLVGTDERDRSASVAAPPRR